MNHHPSHNTPEPLAIELLVTADQRRPRRITVQDHHRWQTTHRPPHEADADLEGLLDELRRVESDYLSNRKHK